MTCVPLVCSLFIMTKSLPRRLNTAQPAGSIGICGSFLRYAWATHLRCTRLWKHNPCHTFCVPDWLKTLQSMAHTIVQMSVLSLPIRRCKLQRLRR
ncbi:hypothetical protein C8Q78DRAFT_1049707 [Trametes maxima]|nr:hypothetical protein C8Q78DRAFT_1049707 [Trametes maxima]